MISFISEKDQRRILGLDVLRGVAILLVIVSHNPIYPQWRSTLYWPMEFFNEVGWMGVDLFFVLSGYILTYVYYETFFAQQ